MNPNSCDRTRRRLTSTLLAGAAGALAIGAPQARAARADERSAPAGSLLILGGTGFIGPHLTREAISRGWRVTHFNRGRRAPGGLDGVETLIGDRAGSLDALRGRKWDAVIDNTGYVPRHVKASSELLAPQAGYALFVSSISAYAGFTRPNGEDAPKGVLEDPEASKVTNETYGPMKALCERHVLDAFGQRASIVRPGYIVGPGDTTDRFTYWPVRVARGGEMLAPGSPSDPIQIIDVRDLTAWMMALVERRTAGSFNAVSAPREFSMGAIIDESRAVVGAGAATPVWVPEEFLAMRWKPEQLDLPPWAPLRGETAAMSLTPTDRAREAGLRIRPMRESVRDTLAWFRTLPAERQTALKAGLDPALERETLEAWRSRARPGRGA